MIWITYRLTIINDRNNIHLSSVYMSAEAYMYFIGVMLYDQKRFRLLLLCNIRACWKSESLNAICFLRRRKTIINLWALNHGTVEFYFYPWNKKALTGIINLGSWVFYLVMNGYSQQLALFWNKQQKSNSVRTHEVDVTNTLWNSYVNM